MGHRTVTIAALAVGLLVLGVSTPSAQDEGGRWTVVDSRDGTLRIDAQTGESHILQNADGNQPRWAAIAEPKPRNDIAFKNSLPTEGEMPGDVYLGAVPQQLPPEPIATDSLEYLEVTGKSDFEEYWSRFQPLTAADKERKFEKWMSASVTFHWHDVSSVAIAQSEGDAKTVAMGAVAALDQEDLDEVVESGVVEEQLRRLFVWELDWSGEKGEEVEISRIWGMKLKHTYAGTAAPRSNGLGQKRWGAFLYRIIEVQAVVSLRVKEE